MYEDDFERRKDFSLFYQNDKDQEQDQNNQNIKES